MNTPSLSPLVPQGTTPARSRSHVRIAVFSILTVHVLLLGVLLLQGCKRTATEVDTSLDPTNESAIATWVEPTNPSPASALAPAFVPLDSGRDPATTPSPAPVTTTPTSPGTAATAPSTLPGHIYTPPSSTPGSEPATPETRRGSPEGTAVTHVIVSGDSFYVLARKYHTTTRAIAEANPGIDPNRLRPGQKLNIPPPSPKSTEKPAPTVASGVSAGGSKVYEVKSGDNLTRIAQSQGTTIAKLRAANKLTTDRIKVGQKLVIPAGEAAAAKEPVPGIDPSAPAPRFVQ